MGFARNIFKVNTGVELAMQKVREMTADQYRAFVWEVFLRILNETPQYTGKAVANWNISLNSPNYNFDPNLGDDLDLFEDPRQRGDRRWIQVAIRRNQPIVWGSGGGPRLGKGQGGLTYKDKVYICNGVMGDDDEGRAVEAYMEALQDPGYAARKLRAVNKPYEIAQESVIVVATRSLSKGISLPRMSGEDWR